MRGIAMIIVIVSSAACSQRQVYEYIQSQERAECEKEVRTNDYLRCLEETDTSYEEYRRAREEVLEAE